MLFDREAEVAKLQNAFIQSFVQQSQQQQQNHDVRNEDHTSESASGGSSSAAAEYQQTSLSSSKKKKKKRMQQLLLEAQQQAQTQQYQQPNTTRHYRPRHVAILVSPPGTGKTTLVHAALEPLVEQTNGYFLSSSGDNNYTIIFQGSSSSSSSSSNIASQCCCCCLPPPLTVFAKILTQWVQQITCSQQPAERDEILSKLERSLERTMDPTEIHALLQVVPVFKQVLRRTNSSSSSTAAAAAPSTTTTNNITNLTMNHPNNFAVTFRTVSRALAAAVGPDKPIVVFMDDLHDLCAIETMPHPVLDADSTNAMDDHTQSSYNSNNSTGSDHPQNNGNASGLTNLSPTKTQSSAALTLQLLQSFILDVQYIPNLMMVMAFQPVQYDHPLTQFLQQLENNSINNNNRNSLTFLPIVPKNLTETTHVYEWLQQQFEQQQQQQHPDISAETWRDMSTQIIHHPLLSAHGNPLAIHLVLQLLSNMAQTYDLQLKDALKMMVAKLEQIQKRQTHNRATMKQMESDAMAAIRKKKQQQQRHGRRFQSTSTTSTTSTSSSAAAEATTATTSAASTFHDSIGSLSSFGTGNNVYDDFHDSTTTTNMASAASTSASSTVVDDPVLTVLIRHLSTLLDTKMKLPSKRLCQLVACYCSAQQSVVMSTETLKYAWVVAEGKQNASAATLKEAVGEVVGCGLFRLISAPSPSNGKVQQQHFMVFDCSTYRDVIYSHILTSKDRTRWHAQLATSLYGVDEVTAQTTTTTTDFFTTLTHWQRGLDELSPSRQALFAKLCLQAGHASMEWSQYEVACQYYAMGIKALEYYVSTMRPPTTTASSSPSPLLSPMRNGGGIPLSPMKRTKNVPRQEPATAWNASKESYATSVALFLGVARACAYLRHFDDAEHYVQEVLYHVKHSSTNKETSTKSTVERAQATIIQMHCHILQQQHADAIRLGNKALQKLGEHSLHIEVAAASSSSSSSSSGPGNAHSSSSSSESELKNVRRLLDGLIKSNNGSNGNSSRAIAASVVESLEPVTHEKSVEAMKIYDLLLSPAFAEQGSLIATLASRIVKLTLQGGNFGGMCSTSALGFATVGSIFYSNGESEYGSLCERIGHGIQDVFQDKSSRGRMLVIQNSLALPRQGFSEQLKAAYRLCNDVADQDFAMLSTVVSVSDLFVAGGPLNATAEAMKGVYQVLSSRNNQRLLFVVRPLFQMTLNLLGVEANTANNSSSSNSAAMPSPEGHPDNRSVQSHHHHQPHILQGSIIADAAHEVKYVKETHNFKAEFANYLASATLCFYLHKFELCREAIEHCYELPPSEIAVLAPLQMQWLFLDAMSAICILWKQSRSKSALSKETAKLKKKNIEIVERCLKRLEAFALSSPDLVEQKILMIQGELMVLSGQMDDAMSAFERAMEHSEGYDVTCDRALACERAGLALRTMHREDEALDYLEDSMGFYREYGALAKVNHVKGNVIPGWDDE